ncbi:MAG: hypothetical protein HY077_04025 [Elusimicrobia bacterium]|nr:hypothetical protein [Elusimicrobiota bacterium]
MPASRREIGIMALAFCLGWPAPRAHARWVFRGDASGRYRSSRYAGDSSNQSNSDSEKEEPAGPPTIEDARGSFETLVETYVAAHRDPGGVILLKDPAGRDVPLRLSRADSASVRAAGNGLFAGEVLMRNAAGRTLRATAVADLGGTEWRIVRLELPAKRKVLQANDVGRLFAAAVLAHVQDQARRDGAFLLYDAQLQKKRRLKLKIVSAEGISALGEGRYRSAVTMTDLDDGSTVEVDFYANLTDDAGQVYKTALHESGGQP